MGKDISEPSEWLPDPPEIHVYEATVTEEHIDQLRETGELEISWEPHDGTPDMVETVLHFDPDDGERGTDAFRVEEPLQ